MVRVAPPDRGEPDELDAVWRAISARDDKSHKLWTDDYLAAFAQASDATPATLDTKVPRPLPVGTRRIPAPLTNPEGYAKPCTHSAPAPPATRLRRLNR